MTSGARWPIGSVRDRVGSRAAGMSPMLPGGRCPQAGDSASVNDAPARCSPTHAPPWYTPTPPTPRHLPGLAVPDHRGPLVERDRACPSAGAAGLDERPGAGDPGVDHVPVRGEEHPREDSRARAPRCARNRLCPSRTSGRTGTPPRRSSPRRRSGRRRSRSCSRLPERRAHAAPRRGRRGCRPRRTPAPASSSSSTIAGSCASAAVRSGGARDVDSQRPRSARRPWSPIRRRRRRPPGAAAVANTSARPARPSSSARSMSLCQVSNSPAPEERVRAHRAASRSPCRTPAARARPCRRWR